MRFFFCISKFGNWNVEDCRKRSRLRRRRFIPLVQTKKVVSMSYGRSTSSWKPWMRLDLIFSIKDMYINSDLDPLTKFSRSSRSAESQDILLGNISQMITKAIAISRRLMKSLWLNGGYHLKESQWKQITTWS